VVIENIDKNPGDTPPLWAEPGDAAQDDRVLVGVAVNLAMERNAPSELDGFDAVHASLEEIAQQVTECDQPRVGQNQQVPEKVHSSTFCILRIV